MSRIGRDRGWRRPTRESFLYEMEHGSMVVGSPETVARKIAAGVKALGASRFAMKSARGRCLTSSSAAASSCRVAGRSLVRDIWPEAAPPEREPQRAAHTLDRSSV